MSFKQIHRKAAPQHNVNLYSYRRREETEVRLITMQALILKLANGRHLGFALVGVQTRQNKWISSVIF